MNIFTNTLRGFVIVMGFTLVLSCSSGTNGSNGTVDIDNFQPTAQDNETLQALIPVYAAAQKLLTTAGSTASPSLSLFLPDQFMNFLDQDTSQGMFTIGTWNTDDDFPETPEQLFNNTDFKPEGQDHARYPASGFIDNFYDVEGYQAYVEIRETDDGWGDYQVTLYVYQTLSLSVKYSMEQYRVPADDWTFLVDADDGSYNPIGFENVKTFYFDDRVEIRDIQYTRYVDDQVYVTSYFDMPDDFSNSAYTYPETISEPDKRDVSDTEALEEYAQHSTLSIAASSTSCGSVSDVLCSTTSGEEFYINPINDDGERETYSKTYYTTSYQSYSSEENEDGDDEDEGDDGDDSADLLFAKKECVKICHNASDKKQITICVDESAVDAHLDNHGDSLGECEDDTDEDYSLSSKTVLIYQIESNSDEVIKTKTVETHTLGDESYTNTITSTVTINDPDGDQKIDYSSSIATTPSEEFETSQLSLYSQTVDIALEESEVGSNTFTGTVTVTQSGDTTDYAVTIDYENGLDLTALGGEQDLMKVWQPAPSYLEFGYDELSHTSDTSQIPSLSIELDNGTLTADWIDGVLKGYYSSSNTDGYFQSGLGYSVYSGSLVETD